MKHHGFEAWISGGVAHEERIYKEFKVEADPANGDVMTSFIPSDMDMQYGVHWVSPTFDEDEDDTEGFKVVLYIDGIVKATWGARSFGSKGKCAGVSTKKGVKPFTFASVRKMLGESEDPAVGDHPEIIKSLGTIELKIFSGTLIEDRTRRSIRSVTDAVDHSLKIDEKLKLTHVSHCTSIGDHQRSSKYSTRKTPNKFKLVDVEEAPAVTFRWQYLHPDLLVFKGILPNPLGEQEDVKPNLKRPAIEIDLTQDDDEIQFGSPAKKIKMEVIDLEEDDLPSTEPAASSSESDTSSSRKRSSSVTTVEEEERPAMPSKKEPLFQPSQDEDDEELDYTLSSEQREELAAFNETAGMGTESMQF